MSEKQLNVDRIEVARQIITFSWPIFISMIFTEFYNITNSLIVGNYVSLKALSAVSACTWITNIFNYSFYGLGMGAGILIARCYGAKDHKKLKQALDSALVFAFAGGIILTIGSEFLLPLIMKVSNIGPNIYADALNYLRVYLLGNTAVLTYQMCFFILRSFGDTRHQLYYSIISSVANILFGLLFVRVFHLDVIGTALATILSQFIMDVLALRLMFRHEDFDFGFRDIDFSFKVVGEICALGIPAGFQNMLIALSSMLVQSYVNTFSNEVIAGIGVAEKIIGWGQLTSVSISSATMALVAQNIGANDYDRVKTVIRESTILSLVSTIVLVGLIVILAPVLIARFNSDPGVRYYGTRMIWYSFFGPIIIVFSHIYNAACRAAGNVRIPMYIAIFSQVICKYAFVRIGLSISYDVRILYLGTAIGYAMAGILATIYFFRSQWTLEHGLR